MRSLRVLSLLLLVIGAVIAAGCGADDGASSASTSAGGADVVPASAPLYLSINSDLDSAQWQTAEALLERFPGGRQLLDDALSELAAEGIDFETDVQPALGPELVIVGLAASTDRVEGVVLTQPTNEARFDELVGGSQDQLVVRDIDGWKALAETEEALDRYEDELADEALSESEDFEAVVDGLSGAGLVTFFVSGANLLETADLAEAGDETVQGLVDALGAIGAAGGEIVAEAEGFRLNGLARAPGAPETLSYESRLVETAPAETALLVSFNDVDGIISELLDALGESDSDLDQQIGLLELGLGISITDDVLPLFANEGAVLLLPASTESALAIVLEVEDVEGALETIDSVSNTIASFTQDAEPGATTTIDGLEVRQLAIDGEISLWYAGFDGLLVFSTTPEAISALKASGSKLADDPTFVTARETAGMPAETNGFVYVNFDEAIPGLESLRLAGVAEMFPGSLDELSALDWALLYGTRDGDDLPFAGFVAVS